MRGDRIGTLTQSASGKVEFVYDPDWVENGPGLPMSRCMPMTMPRHTDATVQAFLWGLLPDNELTLERIARTGTPKTSSRNVVALLAKVGRDCAGALQFVSPDEAEPPEDSVEWLDPAGVRRQLEALGTTRGQIAGRASDLHGRFSLAGAQPKLALHRDRQSGAWGVPHGDVPTTHIIKLPMEDLDGQAENEHFCMRLAALMGLNTAVSEVHDFDGRPAIVVTRYDRFADQSGMIRRLHQEDVCQALGIHPARKYESSGGPSVRRIIGEVLSGSSDPIRDRQTFVRSLVFNWLIAGTDAHGKNFSIIYGKGGAYRLAKLYDINSNLPYAAGDEKLAMRIGRNYYIGRISMNDWLNLARSIGYPVESMRQDLSTMIETMPDQVQAAAASCRDHGLDHEVIDILVDRVCRHCRIASIRLNPDRALPARRGFDTTPLFSPAGTVLLAGGPQPASSPTAKTVEIDTEIEPAVDAMSPAP